MAAKFDFKLDQGSEKILTIMVQPDVQDIIDMSLFVPVFRAARTITAVNPEILIEGAEIQLTGSPNLAEIKIRFTSALSSALKLQKELTDFYYTLEITQGGTKTYRVCDGIMTVSKELK